MSTNKGLDIRTQASYADVNANLADRDSFDKCTIYRGHDNNNEVDSSDSLPVQPSIFKILEQNRI